MKKMVGELKKLVFGHVSIFIVLLCIAPLFFVGRGLFKGVEIEQAQAEQEDLIVVGVSQLGSESDWRSAHTLSIRDALTKDAGYFLIWNNARQMQENQIKAIRGFISQRVDYIVFAPVVETGWETVLREAKDAHIPVIIIDRMVDVEDDSLYTTWIGTDAEEEGKRAGRWLERYLRKKGRTSEEINIVVLQGTIGSTAELGRSRGFQNIAGYHDNWHILEQTTGDFTATRGKEVMRDMLRRHGDIDVLVSQNDDMTMGAIEAMQEAGVSYGEYGEVTVISFDAIYDALLLVKEGEINVDIECNPVQGAYIDNVIQRLEKGEPVGKSYIVDENVFTKENVEKFLDGRTY